jgi:hypothetical protein
MKKIAILASLFLLVFLVFLIAKAEEHDGFKITIHNKVDKEIHNLIIDYPGGPTVVDMESKSKKTIKIRPENFGEASINLIYEANQSKQSEIIFGYIERGYSGKANIDIESIHEDGELNLSIREKVNLY